MSGYFGKKPGFRVQSLTLSQIRSFLSGLPWTLTDTLTVNKAAQTSVAETLAVFKLADDEVAKVEIVNESSSDAAFLPILLGTAAGTRKGIAVRGSAASDSGTNALIAIQGTVGGTAAAAVRPVVAFDNHTTRLATMWPAGTMFGTETSTAPGSRVEVQDSASQIAFGSAAGQGFLWGSSGTAIFSFGGKYNGSAWIARQTSSNRIQLTGDSFRFHLDTGLTIGNSYTPTEIGRWNATGLGVGATPGCKVDAAGNIRATGLSAPSSGTGTEIYYNAGSAYGVLIAVDRATTTYKELRIVGAPVVLQASGVTVLTAGSTTVDFAVPAKNKTCTTGTRPGAVTVGTGSEVFDTTIGKPIWSNGTIWVLSDGTAA